jgi:TonB family protein
LEERNGREGFISNQKVKGTMRKIGKAEKRAIATVGLMLSLMGVTVLAQQDRKVLSNPTPEYPALARKLGLTGIVKVTVVIGTDGLIKDVQVHGGNPVLVQEVENTLKKWKYAPASFESKIQMEFKF